MMRSTEVDRERAALSAPTSGPFGRDARRVTFWLESGLCPNPLTRLP